jgi:hypothetical protein
MSSTSLESRYVGHLRVIVKTGKKDPTLTGFACTALAVKLCVLCTEAHVTVFRVTVFWGISPLLSASCFSSHLNGIAW